MLLFAIETFYSIRLYEYYDLIPELQKQDTDSNISLSVKKKSILESYNDYTKLVGCNLINPSNQPKHISKDFYIQALLKPWKNIIETKSNEDLLINLQIIEFYTLYLSVKGKKDSNYRNRNEVAFDSKIGPNQIWVTFDFMALFANLPRIDIQYKRISKYLNLMCQKDNDSNKNFYDLATTNPESLYNKIKDYCNNYRLGSQNKFLSWVSIRNIEILDDFTQFLNRIWTKNKNISEILDSIVNKSDNEDYSEYKIFTYDYNEKKFYTINFYFLKVLLEPFANDEFRNLFNEIEEYSKQQEPTLNNITDDKKTIKALKKSSGATSRQIIFSAYPEQAKDENFIKIVNTIIPNGMTISTEKFARELMEKIFDEYQKLTNE